MNILFLYSNTSNAHTSSFADLVENLSPAVVSIASTTIVKNNNSQNQMPQFPEGSPFDEFFKEYFERENKRSPSQRPMVGLGSGFIIKKNGIVVTNNHVITDAEDIIVRVDNKEYEAKVVGADPYMDIAVLKMQTTDKFSPVGFGDSDQARVGLSLIHI